MVQGCIAREGRDRRSGQAEATRAANTASLEREQFSRRAKCSLSFQLLTRSYAEDPIRGHSWVTALPEFALVSGSTLLLRSFV